MSIFMKTRTVGAELFHAEGQTDGLDEAYSRFHNSANSPRNVININFIVVVVNDFIFLKQKVLVGILIVV